MVVFHCQSRVWCEPGTAETALAGSNLRADQVSSALKWTPTANVIPQIVFLLHFSFLDSFVEEGVDDASASIRVHRSV